MGSIDSVVADGTPSILMLNGASGAGKTTVAEPLAASLQAGWIHPDGLWGWGLTTDQRAGIFQAIEFAKTHREAQLVLIDCQFEHQFMADALEHCQITGKQILLHCSDEARRKRLFQRPGWPKDQLETMISWANYLLDEAKTNKVDVVDTTEVTIDDTMESILAIVDSWGWEVSS
jgi:gluconate kinase